jgi:hypothetical protein
MCDFEEKFEEGMALAFMFCSVEIRAQLSPLLGGASASMTLHKQLAKRCTREEINQMDSRDKPLVWLSLHSLDVARGRG